MIKTIVTYIEAYRIKVEVINEGTEDESVVETKYDLNSFNLKFLYRHEDGVDYDYVELIKTRALSLYGYYDVLTVVSYEVLDGNKIK